MYSWTVVDYVEKAKRASFFCKNKKKHPKQRSAGMLMTKID